MLKTRHLIMMAAVLAVLALLVVLQKTRHTAETGQTPTVTLVAETWTSEDLGRITIGYGSEDELVAMSRGPESWRLDTSWDAAVNPMRLDALLRALSGLSGEYRSDTADVLADYGLDDTAGVLLRGVTPEGAEAFALRLGNKPAGQTGEFVRRPDETAVYLSTTSLMGSLGLYQGPAQPDGSFFLDLQAVEIERNDVDAMTLVDASGSRYLVKEFSLTEPAPDDTTGTGPQIDRLTWEWRLDGPGGPPLAKTRVDGVLGAACRVRAVDVGDPAAPAAEYGWDAADRRVILHMTGGDERTLVFGTEVADNGNGKAGVWLRVDDATTVWLVGDYSLDNIFKTVEELRPES